MALPSLEAAACKADQLQLGAGEEALTAFELVHPAGSTEAMIATLYRNGPDLAVRGAA